MYHLEQNAENRKNGFSCPAKDCNSELGEQSTPTVNPSLRTEKIDALTMVLMQCHGVQLVQSRRHHPSGPRGGSQRFQKQNYTRPRGSKLLQRNVRPKLRDFSQGAQHIRLVVSEVRGVCVFETRPVLLRWNGRWREIRNGAKCLSRGSSAMEGVSTKKVIKRL